MDFKTSLDGFSTPRAPILLAQKKMFSIEEGFHGNAIFIIVPQGLAQTNSYHLYMIKQIHFLKYLRDF